MTEKAKLYRSSLTGQIGRETLAKKVLQRPVKINLQQKEADRIVRSAAKRVMVTHASVIKKLADR
jgi:hypothetical protein